jgi:hypothetical protein
MARQGALALAACAALAGSLASASAAKGVHARSMTLSTVLVLSGSYTDTVGDGPGQCGATIGENATFDVHLVAQRLQLALRSGATAERPTDKPSNTGSFTESGNGWSQNDCTSSPVAISCSGPVAFEQPWSPSVTVLVEGGEAIFNVSLGLGFGEQPMTGVCTNADPFDGGGPTDYLGLGDVLNPYMDATAKVPLSRLAKLGKGKTLRLVPKHDPFPSSYDVSTCSDAVDGEVIASCSADISNFKFALAIVNRPTLFGG